MSAAAAWLCGLMVALVVCFYLSRIAEFLSGIHRELVKIRLATESLHDRVVPETLMRQWERTHRK